MPRAPRHPFDLSGGILCLDFANTAADRFNDGRATTVASYGDLLNWSEATHTIPPTVARTLHRRAGRLPAAAAHAMERATQLREAIYAVFTERAPEGLSVLNRYYQQVARRRAVVASGQSFVWAWEEDPDALDRVLWPVVESALALLTSPDLIRVRRCESATCDWLFLDGSRNRSRRWCAMTGCGNRHKARRFQERLRAARSS